MESQSTLAILTTHPIQYQVPVWRELTRRGLPLEVWYLSDHGHRKSFDRGFGKEFLWDLDMLGGYESRLLPTRPAKAKIGRFRGARIGSLDSLFRGRGITALLINGWFPQAYWQAAFQAHRAGIPILLRAETNDLRSIPWWKELAKRRLLKLLFNRVSLFLTIGVANRRFYLKYGVAESKLRSAPYCVENERFSQAAESFRSRRDELREAWNIPQDSTCFLFCGKLIEKKHVLDLIRAFEMLLLSPAKFGAKAPIHLLVAGDGALREIIEERARRLSNQVGRPCVSLAGFLNQTEVPKAYAVADCLVLPSDAGETWGLVVNEAMACGLPAIVSDQVGCGPDLIDPGVTGDLFPVENVERLAVAMAQWSDPIRCRSAATAVTKKIAAYSIEQAGSGISDSVRLVTSKRQSAQAFRGEIFTPGT